MKKGEIEMGLTCKPVGKIKRIMVKMENQMDNNKSKKKIKKDKKEK